MLGRRRSPRHSCVPSSNARARAAPPLYGNHSDPRRWRINTGTAAAVAPWGAWRRWCWITAPTTPRSATATRTSGEAARRRRRSPVVSDRSPLSSAWTNQPLAFPAARSRRPTSAAAVGAAPAACAGHASSAFLRRRGRCEPRAEGVTERPPAVGGLPRTCSGLPSALSGLALSAFRDGAPAALWAACTSSL